MIDKMKLEAVTTIVTHAFCADGVASAVLLHDVLPDAEIRFLSYGTREYAEIEARPGLLFCDISPPADRVAEFVAVSSIVCDHHKTARAVVESFGENGVFGDEATQPGVCGATLAFEHVWKRFRGSSFPGDESHARRFALLAGIRDTWQRAHVDWREACAQREMLLFFDDWLTIDDFFGKRRDYLRETRMSFGVALLACHERAVAEAAGKVYRFTSQKGTRVATFQGVTLSSDVAELLGADADLVVAFSYECEDGKPKLILSTRSRGDFDCGSFAKRHGGGGHTKAAGFSMPVDYGRTPMIENQNPYSAVEDLLADYENARLYGG